MTISNLLQEGTKQLAKTSESPRLDAEVLLCHALQKTRSYLYAHNDERVDDLTAKYFQELLDNRTLGTPIAYLTGSKEFWSLPLKVTKDTLIPRADTEKLVEITLLLLKDEPSAKILELGTGSGAIAIALAKERPDWQIVACDINPNALSVAKSNALTHAIKNIQFFHSDWFTNLPKQRYHAILSNPPYIAEEDPHLLQGDVRFEPRNALVSGQNGLMAIEYLVKESVHALLPGGLLLLEHGYQQKSAIRAILHERGYANIECWQDWQGQDRVSKGVWP
jgi:release factor glutamine methyltransferase